MRGRYQHRPETAEIRIFTTLRDQEIDVHYFSIIDIHFLDSSLTSERARTRNLYCFLYRQGIHIWKLNCIKETNKYSLLVHRIKIKSPAKCLWNEQNVFVSEFISFQSTLTLTVLQ